MSVRFFFICAGVSALAFFHASQAEASRKADIIRRLHEQDRFEEGEKYCDKWLAVESPPADLRDQCAEIFYRGVEPTSSQAWSDFRTKWEGTTAAENARDPYVELMLIELNGEGTKQEYDELKDLALSSEIKQRCISAGVASALKQVSSASEAKELAAELAGKEELYVLFEKFPLVFFDVKVEESTISILKILDSTLEQPSAIWSRKCKDEEPIPWNIVVKDQLIKEGISKEQVMGRLQNSEKSQTSFPLCPLMEQSDECQLGVMLESNKHTAFIPQAWSSECSIQPVLMSFTKRRLRALSIKEDHLVELVNPLYGEERIRGNLQVFTKLKKKPYLYEGSLYSQHNNAYVVFPLDGNPPFISEKPPGTWKLMMGKKIKGAKIPASWTVENREGIEVDLGGETERSLPSGALVMFSPHASEFLGLSDIEPVSLEAPLLEWNRQKRPRGSIFLEVEPISSSGVNSATKQVFAAGFSSADIEVYDGWSLDLDRDDEEERILRLSIGDKEALAVLDYDKELGPKTYLFETNHAIHGSTRAPVPQAFEQDGKTFLYWTGREGQIRYIEWVFAFGTGYDMGHKEF